MIKATHWRRTVNGVYMAVEGGYKGHQAYERIGKKGASNESLAIPRLRSERARRCHCQVTKRVAASFTPRRSRGGRLARRCSILSRKCFRYVLRTGSGGSQELRLLESQGLRWLQIGFPAKDRCIAGSRLSCVLAHHLRHGWAHIPHVADALFWAPFSRGSDHSWKPPVDADTCRGLH